MATFWSAPTTKDAYLLSWTSLLFTALAALAGILLYSVRFVFLLHTSFSQEIFLISPLPFPLPRFETHRLLNDSIFHTTHRLQDLPYV
jgi:hypothetical protein